MGMTLATMTACRGVRGATTIEVDERETVQRATRELLALMIHLNDIHKEDVASAIFTTTPDISSAFPATAARQLGWLDVPLMCAHEIDVAGSVEHVHPCAAALEHQPLPGGHSTCLSQGSAALAPR